MKSGEPYRSVIAADSRGKRGSLAPCSRRQRRGVAIIYATATMTIVIGFAAFTVDLSRGRSAKGELRAAADGAALNAANGLSDGTYLAKAQAAALENKCDGTAVSIPSANVTPGYWSGTTFTANGTPRNAVRVIAERVKSKGTGMSGVLCQALGWSMPDISGTSIVAVVPQAPYEWVGGDSVSITAATAATKVTSYDATNLAAAQSKTSIKSNGFVTITGPANIDADVRYGTGTAITGATVSGTVQQNTGTLTYPPGSQVANLTGVTPVYSTTTDLTVNSNMVLGGGTYVVKNCNISNCTVAFTGPTTIVVTGNINMNSMAFTTYGNLPANLKIIATVPGTQISITNPLATINADFYAPDSPLTLTSGVGAYGLKGRGVFKSVSATGSGASMWYDRSLTASSLSKKAVIVQ